MKSDAVNTGDRDEDDAVIGRAFMGSAIVFVLIGLIAGVSYYVLTRKATGEIAVIAPVEPPAVRELPKVIVPTVPWSDVTDSAGIQFIHCSGAKGEKLLPETMGSGCAFFDFDSDGDQDILLVNSCDWPGKHDESKPLSTLGLFANDGHGIFSDATKAAGLDVSLYGMGAACGDYDNDGKVDLFISCLGKSRLYHNVGGKFVDVTDQAGVGGSENDWSTSCGWFDCDQDGDLDLLVCHYVEWTRAFDLAQEFRLLGGNETAIPGEDSYSWWRHSME